MRLSSILLMLSAIISLPTVSYSADTYNVDHTHSNVGFKVRHMVISNTSGKFKDYTAEIKFDEKNIKNSSIKATITVASIDTEEPKRDEHLRSADFFDAKKYPTIEFKSSKIEDKGNGNWMMTGKLTIKGVTKEVTLPVSFFGKVTDPWGNERIGAQATLTINRDDYKINFDKTLETGGLIVGKEVEITIDIEAIKAQPKDEKK